MAVSSDSDRVPSPKSQSHIGGVTEKSAEGQTHSEPEKMSNSTCGADTSKAHRNEVMLNINPVRDDPSLYARAEEAGRANPVGKVRELDGPITNVVYQMGKTGHYGNLSHKEGVNIQPSSVGLSKAERSNCQKSASGLRADFQSARNPSSLKLTDYYHDSEKNTSTPSSVVIPAAPEPSAVTHTLASSRRIPNKVGKSKTKNGHEGTRLDGNTEYTFITDTLPPTYRLGSVGTSKASKRNYSNVAQRNFDPRSPICAPGSIASQSELDVVGVTIDKSTKSMNSRTNRERVPDTHISPENTFLNHQSISISKQPKHTVRNIASVSVDADESLSTSGSKHATRCDKMHCTSSEQYHKHDGLMTAFSQIASCEGNTSRCQSSQENNVPCISSDLEEQSSEQDPSAQEIEDGPNKASKRETARPHYASARRKRIRFSSPTRSEDEDFELSDSDSSWEASDLHTNDVSGRYGFSRASKSAVQKAYANNPGRPSPIIYQQQRFAGKIIGERDKRGRGGRGRQGKEYKIQWRSSWMDGSLLHGRDLFKDWKTKKASVYRY